MCCTICVYVLSFAPVYRWNIDDQNSLTPVGRWRVLYKPVEWLIDATPLREPLLVWAEWWNVRSFVETDSHFRESGLWSK